MKKVVLGLGLLIIFSTSVFAGYTTKGDALYYNGNQIAYLEYSYGYKIICLKGRNSGTVRLLDVSKDEAFQIAIRQCRK